MEPLISIIVLAIVFTIAHWWDTFHLVLGVPMAALVLFLIWRWQKSRANTDHNTEPDLFSYKPPAELVVATTTEPSEPDQDPWPRRILFGIVKGGVTLLAVCLIFLIANATPLPSLFYDRGFDKLVSNDIPLLQSANAYDRIVTIGQERLERPLSDKKQKALAQYVYQAMIDWGNGLIDSTARIQKFSEARDFAKKWNADSQLAEARIDAEKYKALAIGPSNLEVGTRGAITQIDTSTFPPVIIAYVSVENANDEPVDGLKSKDFLISNNDAPITKFDLAPISSQNQSRIILAMDVSGSTAGQPLANSQAGAQTFIAMLGDNDLIKIIKFNQSVTVLSWEKDKKKLCQEINKLRAKGNTAIYDAIDKGVDHLTAKSEQSQKAIVLFTDGADTDSKCPMKTALDKAKTAQIPIYVIGLASKDLSTITLAKIASETNGSYLEADSPDKLKTFYQKIGNKIKKQYRIVITIPESNVMVQNNLTISIGRKNGINLAKSYER